MRGRDKNRLKYAVIPPYMTITRPYDKRYDLELHIANFSFLESKIPTDPSYGVCISQLVRHTKRFSHYNHDVKFDPRMLRIFIICAFGIFTVSLFVKNRELRPDKNKFAFVLCKLIMEPMRFDENKSRLIRFLIAFISSLFDDYNFCTVKFLPGSLMTLSVPL